MTVESKYKRAAAARELLQRMLLMQVLAAFVGWLLHVVVLSGGVTSACSVANIVSLLSAIAGFAGRARAGRRGMLRVHAYASLSTAAVGVGLGVLSGWKDGSLVAALPCLMSALANAAAGSTTVVLLSS
eukprot:CAMPEP_0205961936 /NCGR_PEP_ID=MMETSP1459-20131121/69854_1 /ASSEMBLY_ACC=CAM_ASM_001120 /TAXON_ID=41880 /ORGANISM="Pycnococcus provasolii, Strain RCC931" /LENGTH=128 /DNA_ID=CAMNT_0053334695 /DNA_START=16 /DNA_END=402 /DNA_ORIENTATION=-